MKAGKAELGGKQFRLLNERELIGLADPEWLVDGVIPQSGFVELHGPPGTYKSFLTVDVAMAVATGRKWGGRSVKQGPVVYVAAEGASGYKLRVASWREANAADEPAPIYFVTEAVQLLNDGELKAFLSSISEREPHPALIVIDTLSRCFVGEDENSAKSMSLLIAAVDRIRAETGATVLLVHHTNKTGKAERGSIALRGAVDMLMAITRTKNSVTLRCLKMKDGPEFDAMHFQFREHGDSGILVPLVEGAPSDGLSARNELSERDLACLSALPDEPCRNGEWERLAKEAGIPQGSFNRHRQGLLAAGAVVQGPDKLYRRSDTDPEGIGSITPCKGDAVIPMQAPTPHGLTLQAAA